MQNSIVIAAPPGMLAVTWAAVSDVVSMKDPRRLRTLLIGMTLLAALLGGIAASG